MSRFSKNEMPEVIYAFHASGYLLAEVEPVVFVPQDSEKPSKVIIDITISLFWRLLNSTLKRPKSIGRKMAPVWLESNRPRCCKLSQRI